MTPPLVSHEWLYNNLESKKLVLLDTSVTFDIKATIKGAQHFNIKNTFSDTKSEFPNTFPAKEQFEIECQKLEISADSHVIVFDDKGIFNSPRAWWMFQTMGHRMVSILDGGLPLWHSKNLPTGAKDKTGGSHGNFKAVLNPQTVKTYDDILENCKTKKHIVLDARSSGRFTGKDPEPRAHIKSGHIKHSINLPYTDVLHEGTFKSKQELETIFKDLNLSGAPIIFSCGSGITACIILLAYYLISGQMGAVYDGSWTEWAEREGLFTNTKN